ncbi:ribokinase [Mesorhizobium sp. NZP2077]|uniref:ribokinase n=1 Tax=Mesorhizobium sp. NZP2077 TaxID=2483404 RepID=UPI001551834F|nr:ribokinase [Mesorhizobium sp. NZP2077]QKC81367.1 ribokinase [Mesorhizobium sp. NZP2077]QKD14804.1 ribokinase [Mesorhizobium sp. NZP2077]
MTPSTTPLVTVFGSLHYDIMVDAPDRPRKGETVTGHAWHPKCGGKGGNQAVSVARAGARSAMIGAVGDDDFGRALLGNLDRAKVDRSFVRVATGVGSGMSVAIFDSDGDYGAVIVSGSNLTLGERDVAAASEMIARTAVLLLQNEVPEAANIAAAYAVKAQGGRVVLNAAPARKLSDDLIALVDILVVNAIEAEFLAGIAVVETLDGAAQAARRLVDLGPVVIVTAGGEGVACCDRNGEAFALPAIPVKLVSTHGAGDEFVGALAAAFARGEDMRMAVTAANAASALLVSTPEAERQSI